MIAGAWKLATPGRGDSAPTPRFASVVAPGTHTTYYGEFEHLYFLPATQRTYIISANPTVGDIKGVDVVAAPSKDNVLMNFEGAVYFKLNKEDINSHVGGEYFCGPDSSARTCSPLQFVLQAATPPAEVVSQYTATAAAQQGVLTAKQQAAAKAAAAQGDADAQRIRATAPQVPPQATAYIKAQAEAACAANPSCKLVVIDGTASSVQVTP